MVRARRNGMKVKDIVRIFGVSRKTVWKWTKRAKHPGRESFKDLPKTPHRIRRKVDFYVENAILEDFVCWFNNHRHHLGICGYPADVYL